MRRLLPSLVKYGLIELLWIVRRCAAVLRMGHGWRRARAAIDSAAPQCGHVRKQARATRCARCTVARHSRSAGAAAAVTGWRRCSQRSQRSGCRLAR